jgi:hypothetical protein
MRNRSCKHVHHTHCQRGAEENIDPPGEQSWLCRRASAQSYMYLNLRTEHAIANARVVKTEQVSKNRYHNEIKLDSPDAVDAEVRQWLSEAYALGG